MDIAELSMFLETLQAKVISDDEFEEAVQKVKTLPNVDGQHRLILYALYKQSTIGNIDIPPPPNSDIIGTSKWAFWNGFKGFPKNNAKLAYCYLVNELVGGTELTLLDSEKSSGGAFERVGGTISTLSDPKDEIAWSKSEELFQAVVDNNIEMVQDYILKGSDVNVINSDGMTPLHFAADRGYNNILEVLVDNGAVVDVVDNSGLTPLMYAVSCENLNIVETLVKKYKANINIKNEEGQSVLEFDDLSQKIRALLLNV